MIPLSEQYRINIKNAIELIDNTLELVERSNVVLTSKHLKDIRFLGTLRNVSLMYR